MSQIDPLQDALEGLRWKWNAVGPILSEQLHTEAPDLVAAITNLIALGDSAHIEPPALEPGDLQPERLHSALLYVDDDDMIPPRKLSDVWQGRGDISDVTTSEAAPHIIIGSDDQPMRLTDNQGEQVSGPWDAIDWTAKALRERG